ncbi:MAG: tyrosine-protein phosphatase [Halieaceae bacterium]
MQHLPKKLDFEGAHNFRDMGGYPLPEGGVVREGLLYRSDHLGRLTDADQELLGELGIRTVVDLRREEEIEEAADRVDNPDVEQIWLPVKAEGADVISIRRGMERGEVNSEQASEFLKEANRLFTGVFAPVFQDFLHLLLDESRYPLVFHCSAGKDRAGFAAAMTLYALGASDEVVMHDYLATNHCTANYLDGMIDGLEDSPELQVDPEAVRTLMQVVPEYLGQAVDIIHGERGGIHNFLESDLNFGADKRAALSRLLAD